MARFQKHIFMCTNQRPSDHPRGCCSAKGSERLVALFKAELKKLNLTTEVRTNKSGCLDACEFGPSMVIYPEGVWYGGITEADISEILKEHISDGRIVDRLTIKNAKYSTSQEIKKLVR